MHTDRQEKGNEFRKYLLHNIMYIYLKMFNCCCCFFVVVVFCFSDLRFIQHILQKLVYIFCNKLDHANIQLIEPLERFRKEQIGRAKEEKKKFDKETERICALYEAHLKISPKKKDTALQEADAQLEHELRNFREMSLGYVSRLQEVNEKKKFEFVEIMLAFMYGQSTFFHNGHDTFNDYRGYLTDLQYKLQTTRDRFDVTRQEAEDLKNKTIKKFNSGDLHKEMYARQGYLLVHDRRKAGVLGPTWVKHYCMYTKENKILTMIPYNQTQGKLNANTDTLVVKSCVRKPTESSERRFLFEITGHDRSQTITLQSITEDDRKQWLEVMEGREPIYMESSELVSQNEGVTAMNETGIEFVRKCLEGIEKRGLTDQGVYRIAGVSSKFNKLLQVGIDAKQLEKLDLSSENSIWEVKTITSAMKQYFRTLSEPIYTFKLHNDFVHAIKLDTHAKKVSRLQELLKQLPANNYMVLNRLMYHLKMVASNSDKNLMQASNLAVVLGPTLMRPKEETMAAIMSIKFQSIVIETMIQEYDQLFKEGPPESMLAKPASPNIPPSPGGDRSCKYRAPDPPSRPAIRPRSKIDSELSPRPDTISISSNESISPNNSIKRDSGRQNSKNGSYTNHNHYSEVDKYPRFRPPVPTGPKPNIAGGSIKRWKNVLVRPEEFLNKSYDDSNDDIDDLNDVFEYEEFKYDNRYAETVAPFTSPFGTNTEENSVNDTKSRRESYAMALDSRITSTDLGSVQNTKPVRPKPSNRKPRLSDNGPPIIPRRKEWKARTLYTCVAENDAELSFNAGAIITNVRSSTEEGWLIGMLNGKTGLIPENYCEKIE
ncbi:rho GTPase-activating protein 26-like isoform X4 [Hydractinia symbiolongicarpus]|uniref:rho GTPase-activating protein 26-like isoform X4 n=1 Tax=Hydractinia symbiolongicarpus TaxID=13093 RepID=UPI00254F5CE1|nr:rho GTPase-activating protein 26-like isoform X4 [Hydractinia symbiolongicarpus]